MGLADVKVFSCDHRGVTGVRFAGACRAVVDTDSASIFSRSSPRTVKYIETSNACIVVFRRTSYIS